MTQTCFFFMGAIVKITSFYFSFFSLKTIKIIKQNFKNNLFNHNFNLANLT